MFSLVVQLEVRPDRRKQFLAGMSANAEASVRDEPGCLRFDVSSVEGDENRFVLYELYADERAFTEDHRSTPHYEKWRAASAELLEPGGQVNTLASPAFPGDLPEAGA